ncbi:hypothetical protein BO79DRAFT_214571 [Aspergillus costaricaensis CBS 115574]|uniref:Uncharacterized protein n=1 Tax=Aspergillus costaricaensis CBS 115574 TaxID=1448317 RepID=A0ACD1IQ55_9EURO|nr:hypothetical protein BO79DRAFT_214571 [Aspergillus costaricaensis CBS 115574]RAK92397.1 hypothetical protein BO79DRAFT_214571 [Aspergillus costaricaensis CBS 115574]
MPRGKQPHQESCRRSDRIREKVQKESTNIEKQESSSPSNNCTETLTLWRNSAVLDPVTTDQEWARGFIQTVKGSSIHYWVQNNQWPKKLFNSVLGNVITKDDMEMCQGLFERESQKNKTAIVRLMARYIVSSAELETCRGKFSKSTSLVERINEAWTYSVRLQWDPMSASTLHIACKSSTSKLSLLASHFIQVEG